MELITTVQTLVQTIAQNLPFIGRRQPATGNLPPAIQLPLNLDELTDDGLLLRDAIPVRSAEYWLELGYPEMAMEELERLSLRASQNPWPRRVRQQALLATAN